MSSNRWHTGVKVLIVAILLTDLAFSSIQHYNMPLDGDLADIVVPAEEFKHVLTDPFGIRVLTEGEKYANPNRFFFHYITLKYFRIVPQFLQHFTDPVHSIYLACAIVKVLIQLLLIILMSWYISNFNSLWSYRFLFPAFLIFSLFQTMGFSRFMGIIDPSVVYTFAYAWPMIPLLIFYIPLYTFLKGEKKFKLGIHWMLLFSLLAVFLSFNGPLIPAQMIIINGLIIMYWLTRGFGLKESRVKFITSSYKRLLEMPGSILFLLLLSSILSIYSLGLGLFNSLNAMSEVSTLEYYSRVPQGLYYLLTTKLGWPVLIAFIVANIVIIKRMKLGRANKSMMSLFKWIMFFCFIYIALLPLGGYRWYRPEAIRYDTVLPVTLACIFIFARSSYFILDELKSISKLVYTVFILGFVFFFTLTDEPNLGANACEIDQLYHISSTKENPVAISNECTVLSWVVIREPANSKLQGELIHLWNITSEKKTYYQIKMSE